ncbi:MAG: sulfite reductase flavoprotein subunit alpha [Azospirillaceae bacterium]|nr:sulfite reductase flavoprotein subunit alpha [Azospirillaceae bacterium]
MTRDHAGDSNAVGQPAIAPSPARRGRSWTTRLPTPRWVLFQIHWFLGITLGFVLALMGITGATMSFEDQIMRAISPGVVTVAVQTTQILSPDTLMARLHEQRPDDKVTMLVLSPAPDEAARVMFDRRPGEEGRGTRAYVDPYSGVILGGANGEAFFGFVRNLHRWLALPGGPNGIGRQITGPAVFALLFFCLSGLYLRWPRRVMDWRAWLALDTKAKGRAFLWSLHAVAGTWVLVIYLAIGLTGLWWSYDWYRQGVTQLLTGQAPQQERGGEQRGGGREGGGKEGGGRAGGAQTAVPMDTAWTGFLQQTGGHYEIATLTPPARPGAPVRIRYRAEGAPHEYATDDMTVDSASGAVKSESHYADKPTGAKLVSSILAIHRGTFFGTGGAIVFMIAAGTMPLFTVTGLMLYLDRRRKKKAARAAMAAAGITSATPAPVSTALTVAYASQTGTAEQLAWRTAGLLRDGGLAPEVVPLQKLELAGLTGRLLVVASTYGEGEPPDDLRIFAKKVMAKPAALAGLEYAVLALGDRGYEHFCGFGRALDKWLGDSGAVRLFDTVTVDASADGGDTAALHDWQARLRQLGAAQAPDWAPPVYDRWRLAERRLLNPGSPGNPAFHLALEPVDQPLPAWQAGDIVQILPANGDAAVQAFLTATGLDGAAWVQTPGGQERLDALLATSHLPDANDVLARGQAAQDVADGLAALPHREYSIASLPEDGRLDLLVRLQRRPDGTPGLGSGWLTTFAPLGHEVRLRIRNNPGFHPPAAPLPMILIGAGTGLAGLRAHLKHRRSRRLGQAWLVFGERTATHDRLHGPEIDTWQADGTLARVEWAFSRDGGGYVQQRVAAAAEEIRQWVGQGATIYVCGSLQGMAPAVDDALAKALGRDQLDALTADGRYRRDVY